MEPFKIKYRPTRTTVLIENLNLDEVGTRLTEVLLKLHELLMILTDEVITLGEHIKLLQARASTSEERLVELEKEIKKAPTTGA